MAIPVLQLGPGGDYTTQYHAKDGNLIAVMQSSEPVNEDRSNGHFARQQSQPRKHPPRTVSVHPEPVVRASDSYQPSQSFDTGTYTRPMTRSTGAPTPQAAVERLLNLAPEQQQQALDMLANALDQMSADTLAASQSPQSAPIETIEDTERKRAIAHVLEDLRQLRRQPEFNLTTSPTPSSPTEVAYESSALTESDSQATGYRPTNSPVPAGKGLFTDDAGTGRRPERQQGYRIRTRRSAHQKRRPYQGTQQGSLFGS